MIIFIYHKRVYNGKKFSKECEVIALEVSKDG